MPLTFQNSTAKSENGGVPTVYGYGITLLCRRVCCGASHLTERRFDITQHSNMLEGLFMVHYLWSKALCEELEMKNPFRLHCYYSRTEFEDLTFCYI